MYTQRGVVMPASGGGPVQEEIAKAWGFPGLGLFPTSLLPRQQPGYQESRA